MNNADYNHWSNSFESTRNPSEASPSLVTKPAVMDGWGDCTFTITRQPTKGMSAQAEAVSQDSERLADYDFHRKNNDRLELLARKYALGRNSDLERESVARLKILETETSLLNPKFSLNYLQALSNIEAQVEAMADFKAGLNDQ